MKRFLFLFLISTLIYSQPRNIITTVNAVTKSEVLITNYIPIVDSSNSIKNSTMYVSGNNFIVDKKLTIDSINARTSELFIEGTKFSNQNVDIYGLLQLFAGMSGVDTIIIGGFIHLDALDTTGTAGQIPKLLTDGSGNKYVGWANDSTGSGTSDTTHIVAFDKVTGLQDSLDAEQAVSSANADSITAHRGELNTLNGYVDQDVTNGANPTFGDLTIDSAYVGTNLRVGSGASSILVRPTSYPGIWFGVNANSYDYTNYSFLYDAGSGVIFNSPSGKKINFRIGNSTKASMGTVFQVVDDFPFSFGTNDDFQLKYDETTNDRLELSDGTNDFLTVTDAGTDADFNFIGRIESDGYKINTHTITGDSTISANDMYGGVFYVTSAATLTLHAVTSGMSITVITIGAIEASINPDDDDKLWLDGTALDDGDKATNTSTAGDIAVVTYYSGDGWYVSSNSWTDGG